MDIETNGIKLDTYFKRSSNSIDKYLERGELPKYINLYRCNDFESLQTVVDFLSKYYMDYKWIEKSITLIQCCENNMIDYMKYFISKGVSINEYFDGKYNNTYEPLITPLHAAISNHNYELAKILIEAGADVNAKVMVNDYSSQIGCNIGFSALSFICAKSKLWDEDYELIECLLYHGADAMVPCGNGNLALSKMIMEYQENKNKRLFALIELACQNTENLNTTVYGWQKKNRKKSSAYDIIWETCERIPCRNPIFYCDIYYNPEIMDILLKNGADINATYENGFTFLHNYILRIHTFENGMRQTLEYLLKNGFDINQTDTYGRTALLLLLAYTEAQTKNATGVLMMYKLLIEFGANPSITTFDRDTRENWKVSELVEKWKKLEEEYWREQDSYDDYLAEQAKKEDLFSYADEYEKIARRNNYDEDSMESDPDYWENLYSLSDE